MYSTFELGIVDTTQPEVDYHRLACTLQGNSEPLNGPRQAA